MATASTNYLLRKNWKGGPVCLFIFFHKKGKERREKRAVGPFTYGVATIISTRVQKGERGKEKKIKAPLILLF